MISWHHDTQYNYHQKNHIQHNIIKNITTNIIDTQHNQTVAMLSVFMLSVTFYICRECLPKKGINLSEKSLSLS